MIRYKQCDFYTYISTMVNYGNVSKSETKAQYIISWIKILLQTLVTQDSIYYCDTITYRRVRSNTHTLLGKMNSYRKEAPRKILT